MDEPKLLCNHALSSRHRSRGGHQTEGSLPIGSAGPIGFSLQAVGKSGQMENLLFPLASEIDATNTPSDTKDRELV